MPFSLLRSHSFFLFHLGQKQGRRRLLLLPLFPPFFVALMLERRKKETDACARIRRKQGDSKEKTKSNQLAHKSLSYSRVTP